MKRIVSLALSVLLVFSISLTAFADDNISFSDVQPQNWYYEAVMAMSGSDFALFNGVSKIENNVGTFSPNTFISRIQFITVMVRYLFPDMLVAEEKPTPWYSGYYRVALETGLIADSSYPFDRVFLNEAITRQEAAELLVRSAVKRGEKTPEYSLAENSISDFYEIGDAYRGYVVKSYLLGLMEGKGKIFDPLSGLKRAEAAQVVYRLAVPEKRAITNRSFNIVFEEGREHPPCIAGDCMVVNGAPIELKAHGKQNVLLCGTDGVFYSYIQGTVVNGKEYGEGDVSWFDGTELVLDKEYGLLFSFAQWQYLQTALYPATDGLQIGEVRNNWYVWSHSDQGTTYCWSWTGPELY